MAAPITPLARRAHAARELISRGEVDPWVGLFFVVAPPPALEEVSGVGSLPPLPEDRTGDRTLSQNRHESHH